MLCSLLFKIWSWHFRNTSLHTVVSVSESCHTVLHLQVQATSGTSISLTSHWTPSFTHWVFSLIPFPFSFLLSLFSCMWLAGTFSFSPGEEWNIFFIYTTRGCQIEVWFINKQVKIGSAWLRENVATHCMRPDSVRVCATWMSLFKSCLRSTNPCLLSKYTSESI